MPTGYAQSSDTRFSEQKVIVDSADRATSVYATDLTGDGQKDVLSASLGDDKIAWYKNEGGGSFSEQKVIVDSADRATSVYATDLTGDGQKDVLSASLDEENIAWYKNEGSGNFSGQRVITANAKFAVSVHAADLTGDGDQDVLSASTEGDKIAWYENEGGGSFSDQKIITTSADRAESVYAADLTGNGQKDILSASVFDDKIAWYENEGDGSFSDQKIITTSADGAHSVYATDLTGNGREDVISASRLDDKIAWYENEGNGSFSDQKTITTNAGEAESVYAADLTGNGQEDVLSASPDDDRIAWYENEGSGDGNGEPFITTWETSSSAESIRIPTRSIDSDYDFEIQWGDGTTETYQGSDPDPIHTYDKAGTYSVEITGTFPRIYFAAGRGTTGDEENARKLQSIDQWGSIEWESMAFAFDGAANLTYNATDTPDLSSVTNMTAMFRDASGFNEDLGGWDVSSVTEMAAMFRDASSFDQDLGGWDVSNVEDFREFLKGGELSPENYDALLTGWELLDLVDGLTLDAGQSQYTSDAGSARQAIIDEENWTINDGGPVQGLSSIIYVNQEVSSPGNGNSWAAAYQTLQNALAAAETSDSAAEIWVAEGTYYPDEGNLIEERRDTSFVLQDNVEVYGGFQGGETERSGRDPSSNRTLLSGEIQQDADSSNNSFHVVVAREVGSTALLDGFVVRDGRANELRLEEEVFPNGGGLLVDRGSPTIRDVTFAENHASSGGGVAALSLAEDGGGGQFTLKLENVRFLGNKADAGGGLSVSGGATVHLTRSAFRGNVAGNGGAINIRRNAQTQVVSTLLSGNYAENIGGGVRVSRKSSVRLVNVTLAGNRAGRRAGALSVRSESSASLVNSIAWDNAARTGADQISGRERALEIRRSSIEGRQVVSGPAQRFIDRQDKYPYFYRPVLASQAPTTAGDFRLQQPSLLKDVGAADALPAGATSDLQGDQRVQGLRPDLGAYEGVPETIAPNSFLAYSAVPEDMPPVPDARPPTLAFADTSATASGSPDRYRILRRVVGEPEFTAIDSVEASGGPYEFVDTSVEGGAQYIYTVAAVGADGQIRYGRRQRIRPASISAPVVIGKVENEDGKILPDGTVSANALGGIETEVNREGWYLLNDIPARTRGIEVTASAPEYFSETKLIGRALRSDAELAPNTRVREIDFELSTGYEGTVELRSLDFIDRPVSAGVPVVEVPGGGTAFKFYQVRTEEGEPVNGISITAKPAVSDLPSINASSVPYRGFEGILRLPVGPENGFTSPQVPEYRVQGGSDDIEVEENRSFRVDLGPRKFRKVWKVSTKIDGDATIGAGPRLTQKREAKWELIYKRTGSGNPKAAVTHSSLASDKFGIVGNEGLGKAKVEFLGFEAGGEAEAEASVNGGPYHDIKHEVSFPPEDAEDAATIWALFGSDVIMGGTASVPVVNTLTRQAVAFLDRRLEGYQEDTAGLTLQGSAGGNASVGIANNLGYDTSLGLGGGLQGKASGKFGVTAEVSTAGVGLKSVESGVKIEISGGGSAGLQFGENSISLGPAGIPLGGALEGRGKVGLSSKREFGEEGDPDKLSLSTTTVGGGDLTVGPYSLGSNVSGSPETIGLKTTLSFTEDQATEVIENTVTVLDEVSSAGREIVEGNSDPLPEFELEQSTFGDAISSSIREVSEVGGDIGRDLSPDDGLEYDITKTFENQSSLGLTLALRAVGIGFDVSAGLKKTVGYSFELQKGKLYGFNVFNTKKSTAPRPTSYTLEDLLQRTLDGLPNTVVEESVSIATGIFNTVKRGVFKLADQDLDLPDPTIEFPPNSLPENLLSSAMSPVKQEPKGSSGSTTELRSLSWGFYGSDPTTLRGEVRPELRSYYDRVKRTRRVISGLRHGIGGYYRIDPFGIGLEPIFRTRKVAAIRKSVSEPEAS